MPQDKTKQPELPEIIGKIVAAIASQWLVYWFVKKAVLKRGGPEWAAYGFGRMAQLIQAPQIKKELELEPAELQGAVTRWKQRQSVSERRRKAPLN